jgi:hypothetical protein
MDCPVQYCSQNCTIEYTTIYNVSSYIQIVYGAYPHPDWCYNNQAFTDLTIRYCLIANVVSEGLFFDNFSGPAAGGTFVNLIMYGCVLFEGDSALAGSDAVEVKTQAGNYGAFYIYNNTFVCGSTKQDSPADTSPITNSSNPFDSSAASPWVNGGSSIPATRASNYPVGYDPTPYVPSFYLASGSWAASVGATVPAGINTDMNGNTGSNLGAFQSSAPAPLTPGTIHGWIFKPLNPWNLEHSHSIRTE